MRKIALIFVVGLMCLTACAQRKVGERGPRQGGHMVINKDSDSTFVALKNETLKKFKQLTFEDAKTGKGMEHMASFDYGYKIAAVRDWLFRQSK